VKPVEITPVSGVQRRGSQSDDEPLYDSVASDDDYYVISDKDELKGGKHLPRLTEKAVLRNNSQLIAAAAVDVNISRTESVCSNNTTTLQRSKSLAAADREVQASEFCALKEQLECSEKKVQALIASNDDMRSELSLLQSTVKKLVLDNKELQRSSMSPSHTSSYTSHESPQHSSSNSRFTDIRAASPLASHGSPVRSPQSPGSRSHSMYEYRGPGAAT